MFLGNFLLGWMLTENGMCSGYSRKLVKVVFWEVKSLFMDVLSFFGGKITCSFGALSKSYWKMWIHVAIFEVKQEEINLLKGRICGTGIFNRSRLNPDCGLRLTVTLTKDSNQGEDKLSYIVDWDEQNSVKGQKLHFRFCKSSVSISASQLSYCGMKATIANSCK